MVPSLLLRPADTHTDTHTNTATHINLTHNQLNWFQYKYKTTGRRYTSLQGYRAALSSSGLIRAPPVIIIRHAGTLMVYHTLKLTNATDRINEQEHF